MNDIIDYQREKFDELFEKLEFILINLDKSILEMDNKSQHNLVEKLRLFNNSIDNLDFEANDILCDIKNNISLIDNSMNKKIEEHENNSKLIKKLYPIMLLSLIHN